MPKIFRIAAIRSLDFVLLGIHQPPAFLCFCPTTEEAGNQRKKTYRGKLCQGLSANGYERTESKSINALPAFSNH